jgi:hypothetical protein
MSTEWTFESWKKMASHLPIEDQLWMASQFRIDRQKIIQWNEELRKNVSAVKVDETSVQREKENVPNDAWNSDKEHSDGLAVPVWNRSNTGVQPPGKTDNKKSEFSILLDKLVDARNSEIDQQVKRTLDKSYLGTLPPCKWASVEFKRSGTVSKIDTTKDETLYNKFGYSLYTSDNKIYMSSAYNGKNIEVHEDLVKYCGNYVVDLFYGMLARMLLCPDLKNYEEILRQKPKKGDISELNDTMSHITIDVANGVEASVIVHRDIVAECYSNEWRFLMQQRWDTMPNASWEEYWVFTQAFQMDMKYSNGKIKEEDKPKEEDQKHNNKGEKKDGKKEETTHINRGERKDGKKAKGSDELHPSASLLERLASLGEEPSKRKEINKKVATSRPKTNKEEILYKCMGHFLCSKDGDIYVKFFDSDGYKKSGEMYVIEKLHEDIAKYYSNYKDRFYGMISRMILCPTLKNFTDILKRKPKKEYIPDQYTIFSIINSATDIKKDYVGKQVHLHYDIICECHESRWNNLMQTRWNELPLIAGKEKSKITWEEFWVYKQALHMFTLNNVEEGKQKLERQKSVEGKKDETKADKKDETKEGKNNETKSEKKEETKEEKKDETKAEKKDETKEKKKDTTLYDGEVAWDDDGDEDPDWNDDDVTTI